MGFPASLSFILGPPWNPRQDYRCPPGKQAGKLATLKSLRMCRQTLEYRWWRTSKTFGRSASSRRSVKPDRSCKSAVRRSKPPSLVSHLPVPSRAIHSGPYLNHAWLGQDLSILFLNLLFHIYRPAASFCKGRSLGDAEHQGELSNSQQLDHSSRE